MKKISKSLREVLNNSIMKKILDLSIDPKESIDKVRKLWKIDLFSRKPKIYNNFTDLDLSTVLYELNGRKAVIEFEKYQSHNAKTLKSNEIIADGKRKGNIKSLHANKDVFKFSVRIDDESIVKMEFDNLFNTNSRNFLVTDAEGNLYRGCEGIKFEANSQELEFFNDNGIFIKDHKVKFKHFIHPIKWSTFYSQKYFLTKALILRLEKQKEFVKLEIERLLKEGIYFTNRGGTKKSWPKVNKLENEESKTVTGFQARIKLPDFIDCPKSYESTEDGLRKATKDKKTLTYRLLPEFAYLTRMIEYAFYRSLTNNSEKFPSWITGAKWMPNYKDPGKGRKSKWNRLVLFQENVGEIGISLQYRTFDKKIKVKKIS